jgi:hypothetical protein
MVFSIASAVRLGWHQTHCKTQVYMGGNFVPDIQRLSDASPRVADAADGNAFRAPGRKHRGPSTGLALLVSFVFLALGMLAGCGLYSPPALILVLLSFACLIAAFTFAWRALPFDRAAPGVVPFAAGLILCLLVSPVDPPGFNIQQPAFDITCRIWSIVFACLVAACYLPVSRRLARGRQAVFVLGVLAAFALRIWMPIASPAPVIDVFALLQESSQHLVQGKNPYATPVSDVYRGEASALFDTPRTYDYLPANLYLLAPVRAVTGDVRYGYVVAEAGIAAALWWLARRRWPRPVAELLPLLFLYHPRSLFVLEQSWTEPLILLFFALFLFQYERGRRTWAAAAYGYMLSLKLYLLYFVFHWLFVERNWRRLLLGSAIATITVLPFLLLDWRSFLAGTLFVVNTRFRLDSLTIFGYLAPALGLYPPKIWTVGVGAVFAAALLPPLRKMPPLRGYLFAVTITMFAMFVFGSQAFCNYYYFVSGILLFLLAVGGAAEGGATSNPSRIARSGTPR